MSYILDALRRAEAQRQQQNPLPPGLGSAPLAAPPAAAPMASATATTADALTRSTAPAPDAGRAGGVPGRQLGWLMLLVAATAGALLLVMGQEQPPASGKAPPAEQAAPATPAAPVIPLQPLPAEPAAPILQPAPPPPPAVAAPAAPAAPVAPAVPAAARKQPGEAIPRYAELPEAVRAGLPAISVQGVTWSENAALRHLIVNGRVLQEGQSIGPDHVLEQIGREGSVLSYRGQRYRIGH